jgi:hypothetical protein
MVTPPDPPGTDMGALFEHGAIEPSDFPLALCSATPPARVVSFLLPDGRPLGILLTFLMSTRMT